jgi:hypothetical protein
MVTMRIVVTDTLGDLQRDLERLPQKAAKDVRAALREGGKAGNQLAKDSAVATARRHGVHYPKSFRVDPVVPSLFGGIGASVEYGPVSGMPQGGMEFEEGSRNQPPHRDLAKSSPSAIGLVAQEIRRSMDGWFW